MAGRLPCDERHTSTSQSRVRSCGPTAQQVHSHPICLHCARACTALPHMPHATQGATPPPCRSSRPFASSRAAPARPARAVAVARPRCVFGLPFCFPLPSLIRLLCFWLGLLSVCFRSVSLVSRPLVPSRSQRPLDPPGRPRMRSLCAGPYAGYPMVLVCNRHACGSCSVLSPSRFVSDVSTRTRRSLTSPRNLHTPHTPHHIHSSYTTIPTNLSTLPLVLVHTSLGWCTVYCMPWMHFVLIDQV